MSKPEIEHFYPKTKEDWRAWLAENHIRKDAVWLIHYKQNADRPTVRWSDAVDEALCFGWIDSKAVTVDETSYKQYYCKRKPTSTWSKVNKEKLTQLIAANKMTDAGLACIEVAKQNGSWTILDEVLVLIVIRIILSPIATKVANDYMGSSIPGYAGHVDCIRFAFLRGAYQVEGMYLDKIDSATHAQTEFVSVRMIDLSLEWAALFKGRIVASSFLIPLL